MVENGEPGVHYRVYKNPPTICITRLISCYFILILRPFIILSYIYTHGGEQRCIQGLSGEPDGKRPLGRPRRR
jgi:hypothetical protein